MRKKIKIENSLGMFDLYKGIAMLLMVFFHIKSLFPSFNVGAMTSIEDVIDKMPYVFRLPIFGRILFSIYVMFPVSMMPSLLIVAGYGYRKRSISKALKLNAKELLKPYIITALATTLANVVMHYAFFRYLPGALKESGCVFGGFILGLSQTTQIGNVMLYANGPMWYILAMFWALTVYNIIINKLSGKKIPYFVCGVSIVGWLLSYIKNIPFCLSQGLIGVIYVGIGHYLKKSKFFLREHAIKEKIIILFTIIVPNFLLGMFGCITEMADNIYSLGPINYVENGLFGVLVLYLFLRLNGLRGKITSAIRKIGRYSLFVMSVHTAEMIAIPWYVVAEHFQARQLFGLVMIYIIKLLIIFTACLLIIKTTDYIKRRDSK